MSTLRCEVVALADVRPHPDADKLELATIKGWQMVIPKDRYKTGDLVVYIEAGTAVPEALAVKLGVVPYLDIKADMDGVTRHVVGQTRLRGEPSFGLVAPVEEALALMDEPEIAVLFAGQDVSSLLGVVKYRPPVNTSTEDAEPDHEMFAEYTDIENMQNFPDVIADGEEVVVKEKLHGKNVRVGFIQEDGAEPQSMGGSRSLRRKDPGEANRETNTNWLPWTLSGVKALMAEMVEAGHQQVILFGESFGAGIEGYKYGFQTKTFRAFDLLVDGNYLDEDVKAALFKKHGIPEVPILYRGPFSLAKIKELSDGPSEMHPDQPREGTVTTPIKERRDIKLGRVILKYIGDTHRLGSKKGKKLAPAQDFTDQ